MSDLVIRAKDVVFLLMFIPLFVLPMLPAPVRAKLLAAASGLNATAAALTVVLLLAIADTVILLVADARFRRNRLILD